MVKNAIAELNKMDGAYAPEKHAHLVQIARDLTDEELIAIASNGDKASRSRERIIEETAGS